MLVYLDSSVLARAYLADEPGHDRARELLEGADPLITATRTRVEVSSTLSRAARSHRAMNLRALLDVLDFDLGPDGPVTTLRADTESVERRATELVREHAIRSLDALHLAVASLSAPALLDDGEVLGFATRDSAEADVARALGFTIV